jgi:hypothetical protein
MTFSIRVWSDDRLIRYVLVKLAAPIDCDFFEREGLLLSLASRAA